MKLPLPASPIRRVDVAVGGAIGLWLLAGVIEPVWASLTHPTRPVHPARSGENPFLPILIVAFLLAAANACVGTILGRPWGFRWMAGLMAVDGMGSFSWSLILGRGFGGWVLPEDAFFLAVFAYCLFRLGSLRREASRQGGASGPACSTPGPSSSPVGSHGSTDGSRRGDEEG